MNREDQKAHRWRESVGNCICCWSICDGCRLCKCQVRTRKATICQPREPMIFSGSSSE